MGDSESQSLPLSETPFFSQSLHDFHLPGVSILTATHLESVPTWPFSMEPETPSMVPETPLLVVDELPDLPFVTAAVDELPESELMVPDSESISDTVVPESDVAVDLAVDSFIDDEERRPYYCYKMNEGQRIVFLQMLEILCPRALRLM